MWWKEENEWHQGSYFTFALVFFLLLFLVLDSNIAKSLFHFTKKINSSKVFRLVLQSTYNPLLKVDFFSMLKRKGRQTGLNEFTQKKKRKKKRWFSASNVVNVFSHFKKCRLFLTRKCAYRKHYLCFSEPIKSANTESCVCRFHRRIVVVSLLIVHIHRK